MFMSHKPLHQRLLRLQDPTKDISDKYFVVYRRNCPCLKGFEKYNFISLNSIQSASKVFIPHPCTRIFIMGVGKSCKFTHTTVVCCCLQVEHNLDQHTQDKLSHCLWLLRLCCFLELLSMGNLCTVIVSMSFSSSFQFAPQQKYCPAIMFTVK